MINKRRISRVLYLSVVLLGLFLLFMNLLTNQQAQNVAVFAQIMTRSDGDPVQNHANTQSTTKRKTSDAAVITNTPKVTQKSIILSKVFSKIVSLETESPEQTTGIDTGLVRLYNKIAVRKIQSIFDKTLEQENSGVSLREGSHNKTKRLPLCSDIPNLQGFHNVDLNGTMDNYTESDVEMLHPDVNLGHWRPSTCTARHKVAIIVPFRDREKHLIALLKYLIPIWKRQEIYFKIYVIEQYGDEAFNKGRIMNAGFLEALKQDDFHCFVFHDVDLVPLNDYNMYSCPLNPRHMSVLVDELDNKYPYDELAGGVFSIRTEHFQLVNGYNNLFWGWGAEDDDMGFRVNILHNKKQRSHLNGVNSVSYTIISVDTRQLYQHIVVDIGKYDNTTLI